MSGLIYQKIPQVMADIEAITKDRNNTQQGYTFRGIDDVYNEVHSVFSKHKIFTTTEVLSTQREERQSKSGTTLLYSILTAKFTFYAEDGSYVSSTMVGEGMDSGDKASNKAMAVAHKYAILQIFVIPTIEPKDPELSDFDLEAKQVKKIIEKEGDYIVQSGTKLEEDFFGGAAFGGTAPINNKPTYSKEKKPLLDKETCPHKKWLKSKFKENEEWCPDCKSKRFI